MVRRRCQDMPDRVAPRINSTMPMTSNGVALPPVKASADGLLALASSGVTSVLTVT